MQLQLLFIIRHPSSSFENLNQMANNDITIGFDVQIMFGRACIATIGQVMRCSKDKMAYFGTLFGPTSVKMAH